MRMSLTSAMLIRRLLLPAVLILGLLSVGGCGRSGNDAGSGSAVQIATLQARLRQADASLSRAREELAHERKHTQTQASSFWTTIVALIVVGFGGIVVALLMGMNGARAWQRRHGPADDAATEPAAPNAAQPRDGPGRPPSTAREAAKGSNASSSWWRNTVNRFND